MGAPGVRIELKDSSQYTVIENPNAVGAIVGFAPKGELNKVVKLTNTATMDRTFGIGFNNWKYNQGMYAARAVLDAGGHVQYVRPYGEEIDMSDSRKRDLKTDCFVVSYDRKAAQHAKGLQNSIGIEYFAATRYKSDGAAGYGVTRKINNISETVSSGSNVDFRVFADESFKESEKSRGDGDAVLFAIMGADPSSARRAVTTYDIVGQPDDLKDRDPDTFRVTLAVNPGFIVGDVVYGPADTNTKTFCKFVVVGIDGKDVDISAADEATHNACMMGYKPSTVLMFSAGDTVDGDADYLTVKTAVTGRGAKLFSALRLDSEGIKALSDTVPNGWMLVVKDQGNNNVAIRIANENYQTFDRASNPLTSVTDPELPVELEQPIPGVCNNDVVTLEWEYGEGPVPAIHSGTFLYAETEYGARLYVDDSAWFVADVADPSKFGSLTVRNLASGWTSDYDYVTLDVPSRGEDESDLDYAGRVRDALVAAFRSSRLGYTGNVVANDIDMGADEFVAGKTRTIRMTNGSAFDYAVGDLVAIVRGQASHSEEGTGTPEAIKGDGILKLSTVTAINGFTNEVTVKDAVDASFIDTVSVDGEYRPDYRQLQLLNLSATNKTAYAAMPSNSVELYDAVTVTVNGTPRSMEFVSEEQYAKGTKVKVALSYVDEAGAEQVEWLVTTVETYIDFEQEPTGPYVYTLSAMAPAGFNGGDARVFTGKTDTSVMVDLYLIGNYDVTVNSSVQKLTAPVVTEGNPLFGEYGVFGYQLSMKDTAVVMQSDKVLRDSDIGANFVGLGLANLRYEDVNYTGTTEKVYDLTAEGESVARLYMSCTYRFNGQVYNFDGTVVEYVHNETQLFIGDTADTEFEGSGLKFVLNESGILDSFLEDESWDLSETVVDGIPAASVTAVSFNRDDPAVVWNAIWTYDPKNNASTSTLATAYSLFLDKDKADQTFFVAAGNDINNFGWSGRESLNTTVIQAILNICELRKDCFALFDGVAEQNIDNALKKDVVRFPSTLGRWGAIYDARPLFYDSMITRRNVEIAPSITMASLITANRSGAIFWYVPAGKDTGIVPSAWCTRVKYERKFNYPEDPDSDIARLCDAHVNPFRTNDDGIFCWGDFTMQMEDSAFNQIHVAMLIAGIHKIFYKYLDGKVFRLNTAALRSQISSDLQAKLNMMRDSNPSAFYDAVVICDDTNNTPEVIDQNKLFVDLKLKPTKSTRYIYLRTEVLATSSGNSITISNV
jgi:phage tail sheath protein FI